MRLVPIEGDFSPGIQQVPVQCLPSVPPPPRVKEWDGTYTPSITNLFWGPVSLFTSAWELVRAKAAGDKEGQFDARLKLIGAPITILHALSMAFSAIVRLAFFLHETAAKSLEPLVVVLGFPTIVLGLGLCLVEGIYEAICTYRSAELIYRTGLRSDNDDLVMRKLAYFEATYLTVNDAERSRFRHIADHAQRERMAMAVKCATLDRRITPRFGADVRAELGPILQTLRNPETTEADRQMALEQARTLLSTIDTQAKKKLLIHVVGLAAIILCAASFVLSLLAGPAGIPLALMTIGGVFATANYFYAKGALDEQGWGFSAGKAFPPLGWLYDRIVGPSPAP